MNDHELKQNIKSTLDDITNNIDVASQVKLNAARHAAITQSAKNKSMGRLFLFSGSAAAIFMAVILLWNQSSIKENHPQAEIPLLEDLDLLSTEADPEFYQDLEFLSWLEESQILESDI